MMDALAQVLERVANTSSRNRKVLALSHWLAGLADADLERAVRFLSGKPVAGTGERKMSVGHAVLRQAGMNVCGWDLEMFRLCHRTVGDSSETISLLLHGKTANEDLSLAGAESIYTHLFEARKTQQKIDILTAALRRMRPATAKYFLKVITGNFRIGLQERLVEEALAKATHAAVGAVKDANNRSGDLAQVALSARRGTLDAIAARLFHPMEFMLARPLDQVIDVPFPEDWYVEDKYDGIRSQVHFENGKVAIFTRGMEDTTNAFPEIVDAFSQVLGSAVIDGEVLAWRDGRAMNFTMLQQRLARKKLTAAMREDIPVIFMGYDALYRNGELLLDQPIEARRETLEALFAGMEMPLRISPQRRVMSHIDIEETFVEARARGNEGLLLKRQGSLYEAAKRSANWLKVKRPYGTLDVVVTAAEVGTGRRATMLSDYTFAVRSEDRYLNVGKAYSGLTDEEIRSLTKVFRSIARETYGRVTLVEPQVVLEVAFDGVQKSPRHKSGYALRFPRILRWRTDKVPADIDTLERVKEMYENSLAR